MSDITVVPTRERDHGACPCCGGRMLTVGGEVQLSGVTRAAYYARWTAGRPHDDVLLLFSVGTWHVDGVRDHQAVGLRYRVAGGQPGFMVIDATDTPWGRKGNDTILGAMLRRNDVVGTELARTVFEFVEQVIVQDSRILRHLSQLPGRAGN